MKALISPIEIITNSDNTSGYRIAQINNIAFEVTQELFWVDCADNISASEFYYEPITKRFLPILIDPPKNDLVQPMSKGTQNF
jgi:hypothetical protein